MRLPPAEGLIRVGSERPCAFLSDAEGLNLDRAEPTRDAAATWKRVEQRVGMRSSAWDCLT